MRKLFLIFIAIAVGCAALMANWPTFGGDPQRSGWAKDETAISPDSVKHFELLWKLKLDNQPKELNSLTPPIVVNPVYTNQGAETYAVVGGSSDNLFVVDTDTGKLVWQKHFENNGPAPSGPQSSGSYFCPNALNDTPVVRSEAHGPTVYVISTDGKLHGLNLVNGEDRFPPKAFVPAYSKNWSLNIAGDFLYTSISQGCAQAKSGVYGMDLNHPDQPPVFFQTAPVGAGIWGRGGVAVASNGNIYAETGDGPVDPNAGRFADSFVALSSGTLKLLDYFTPANANYLTRKDLDMGNSTPAVFPYKGRELMAGSGKEGSIFLLDAKSLGGDTHRKPLYQTPLYANEGADIAGKGFWGAFSTWEDAKGTRWLYAAAWGPIAAKAPAFAVTNGPSPHGSIVAFKVEDKDGQPVLVPAWVSRDMDVPEPPVVANGVVFAISSGEFTRQFNDSGTLYTAQERIAKTTGNATLYAFDAETGKELYSSGKSMPSFTHFGALAVSDGRVYATTFDSTLYAFGVKGE